MSNLSRQIGRKLRSIRERGPSGRAPIPQGRRVTKVTLEMLAEQTGLSADYIGKVEAGKHVPSAETVAKLAKALGVHPGDLFPVRAPKGSKLAGHRAAMDDLVAAAARLSANDLRLLTSIADLLAEQAAKKG
jgi:transcriptional regulator with XRE-family HTH domain